MDETVRQIKSARKNVVDLKKEAVVVHFVSPFLSKLTDYFNEQNVFESGSLMFDIEFTVFDKHQ